MRNIQSESEGDNDWKWCEQQHRRRQLGSDGVDEEMKKEEMERKKKGVATMSGEEWARRDNHIFRV